MRRLVPPLLSLFVAAGSVQAAAPSPPQAAKAALDRFAATVAEVREMSAGPLRDLYMATPPRPMTMKGLCQVNALRESYGPSQPVEVYSLFKFRLLLGPDWRGAPALTDASQDRPDRRTVAGCGALHSSEGFFVAANSVDAWMGSRLFAQAMVAVSGASPWPLEVLCDGGTPCAKPRPYAVPGPESLSRIDKAPCPAGAPAQDLCYEVVLSNGADTWVFRVEGYDAPTRIRLVEHGRVEE